MKSAIQITLVSYIVIILNFVCFGQSPTSTPNTELEQQRRIQQIKRDQKAYEQQILGNGRRSRRVFRQSGKVLRYPNKAELKVMSANKDFIEQYKDFLKIKGTGLTRLNSADNCGTDSRVVVVDAKCIRFEKIPGYGSSYSFRVKRYATGRFSDVLYRDGVLYSSGDSTIGFLTNLGDVPIENVSDKTAGARYIYEFVPEREVSKVEKQNQQLVKGLIVDDFIYRKYLKLSQGSTYLLRSVAYKVKSNRQRNGRRIRIDNTTVDKRLDIVLAFRVIEFDTDGSVTLLWKILNTNKAPKLTFAKRSKK